MVPFVDCFLAQKYPRDHFDFSALKVGDITSFVRKQATELGSVQAKHMVSSLRSFFRYLRHPGEIDTDLAGCVPCVPVYSFSTIPRFLPPGAVEKILRRTVGATPRTARLRGPDAACQAWTPHLRNRPLGTGRCRLGTVRSRFEARADDGPKCRCRLTSAKPLLPICSMIPTAQAAAYSSVNAPRLQGCKADAQS